MRIVSLVPHATELLFALGLGDEVVAVTHECDYPPGARELPRVTRDALPAGLRTREIDRAVRERTLAGEAIYELDREALAAAEPDLIVTQALCPVCAVSYEDVARIARELPTRPRVIALDPQTLRETHADVKTVAEATGRGAQGAHLVAQAGARMDAVRAAVDALPRPRVVALEWLDPPYVAGHWTPQMIELAGGQDVAGRPGEPSYGAGWEELQALAPEVVIVMPCGYDAARAHTEALEHLDSLAPLRARRIVAVDASAYFSRPGPRLTEGVELLGHILHPGSMPSPPSGAQALAVEPLTVGS
jgi:iron complex transport system substrate-binding protein